MAYSELDDLLLGDLRVGQEVDLSRYIRQAAEEMDSKLGVVYQLPLVLAPAPNPLPDPNDWTALPTYQTLLLKQVNNKMASGRAIMALSMSEEANNLHAYALRLVTEATNELHLLANGEVPLDAARRATSSTRPDMKPSITNGDSESATEMFEHATMRPGEVAYWRPGQPPNAPDDVPLYIGVPFS